jgi:hypothetical protein
MNAWITGGPMLGMRLVVSREFVRESDEEQPVGSNLNDLSSCDAGERRGSERNPYSEETQT